MQWKLIIKFIFIFVYSLSNISTAFFFIPIIFQYIQDTNTTITWLHLAIFFSSYEVGRLIGNFIWMRLNKVFSVAIILLSSLIPLTILHFSFGFFTSLLYILIHRFIVGIFNSLPLILKKVLSEMSLEKKTLNIYIITSIASCLSVLLPCLNKSVISSLPETLSLFNIELNQFAPASFLLGSINLLTIAFVIVILQMKLLKLKSNSNFIEMNIVEGNDISNDIVNKKKISTSSFVIKKQSLEEQQSAERDPIDKNSNRFETIDKQEEKREQTDATKEKGAIKGTVGNISFKGSIVNFNPITQTTSPISNKALKLSSIYLLIHLTDGYYLILSVILLYIHFDESIGKISFGMIGLTAFLALISYPITKKLIKPTGDRSLIVSKSRIILFISFAFVFLIGVFLVVYSLAFMPSNTGEVSKDEPNSIIPKQIIFLIITLFILARNVLNSILMKYYQLYSTIDLQVDIKNRKLASRYQLYFSILGKLIAYFIGSLSYYFLSYAKGTVFPLWLTSILFFIALPEGLLLVSFYLIKVTIIII